MSIANSKWTKLVTGAIKFLPEAQWVGIFVELLTQLASAMGATSGDSKEALKHIEALHAAQRNALSQITAAHVTISQQIATQGEAMALHSEKLDALSAELHLTKLAADSIEERLTKMEARSSRGFFLLAVLFLCSVGTLLLTALIFLHLRWAH